MVSNTNQPYTTLSNGIGMPLLGLGVYDMHGHEAEQAVQDALEIGYRLFDTASLYDNENEIGNALRNSSIPREDIFVTTKLGNDDHGYDAALRAFEKSLVKLQMDYVDLYLVHWPVKGQRKESWKALEKLYNDKRVRAIGVANYSIEFLDELETYATITPMVNQVEFTPWLFQGELLQYCQNRNIQLQSYSPLTRGLKLGDPRLIALAEKYDRTPAQIVLRWNFEHGISTIPKSVSKKRLKENFESLAFKISEDDVALMDGFNENFRICDNPMDMF